MGNEVDVQITQVTISELETELLVVPVSKDQSEAVAELDSVLGTLLATARGEGFKAQKGQLLTLAKPDGLAAKRVCFAGLGEATGWADSSVRGLISSAWRVATGRGASEFAVTFDTVSAEDEEAFARFAGEGSAFAAYQFDRYKQNGNNDDHRSKVSAITVHSAAVAAHEDAFAQGRVLAGAVCTARDWVNEPASVCTPTYLGEQAKAIAEEHGLSLLLETGVEALDARGMGLFSAVGRGSDEPPAFIHLTYLDGEPTRRLAFVGKGVTYDSGGYSMKSSAGQIGMHADMAGGAAVLGAAKALGALKPKNIEIHFIVPAAENLVSSNAYKVNDIVTGLNGKTVEITNTDAEGRLLLADALAYAVALKPDVVVDVATLTGACALTFAGTHAAVLGSDQGEVDRLLEAGIQAGEPCWQLPLVGRLKKKLKSPRANVKNSAGRLGSTITAALFLREFVGETPWVHIDIAGMARSDETREHNVKGATGFGVLTLCAFACPQ